MVMERKFQVFISSTYLDLQDERQAAVQAILDAGHIPAGMECLVTFVNSLSLKRLVLGDETWGPRAEDYENPN